MHLRIVAPADRAEQVDELLAADRAVVNLARFRGGARKPDGDLFLCDVTREDASLVAEQLIAIGIDQQGSLAIEAIDTSLSRASREAERNSPGEPADAVVWQQVESRVAEETSLSWTFLVFMAIATMIAAIAMLQDSEVLLVGAMVVGPEFGPMAALCVGVVQGRPWLMRRSFVALAVGFPIAIGCAVFAVWAFKSLGVAPSNWEQGEHAVADVIGHPDAFTFIVAFAAGIVGMLSLTSAKSGALIGVLISIATIPSAGLAAVAAIYRDGELFVGSVQQLALNMFGILLAGVLTLSLQRVFHSRRRRGRELY